MPQLHRPRPLAVLIALTGALAALCGLLPAVSHGSLGSVAKLAHRLSVGRQQAGSLSSQIDSESTKIDGYEGTISSLTQRLDVLQKTIEVQQQQLGGVSATLANDEVRLHDLQTTFARDRQVLAQQMIQRYETPLPSMVDVIVDSDGWDQLLNGLSQVNAIAKQDAQATLVAATTRTQLEAQTKRLYAAKAAKLRQAAAVIAERDQIANLKLSIVDRQLAAIHQRNADSARLEHLRGQLSSEANTLAKQAEAAAVQAYSTGGVSPVGCVNTPFVAHDGPYGFFQAPGTDYSVNEEPVIAARLDALGLALKLHLVGISGYRSPEHSVEVGGFADDPHTRGEASDTPGVEGVPEATLEQFCLTRPFPGPREADHIQELGSPA